METTSELLFILPAIIVALGGVLVMMIDAFSKNADHSYWASVGVLAIAFIISIRDLFLPGGEAFYSMIVYGGAAAFGVFVVLLGTIFTVVMSRDYLKAIGYHLGEMYSMILFATTGMLILVGANTLITLFLGIETMSVALYVLAGFIKKDKTGVEAALKYFLLGAFATGFLLYGIALLYGATGSIILTEIAASGNTGMLFWMGVALLFVGFFFKISAVPFHMWTPDVYQGAPTNVTAYMATAAKAASIVAFILVLGRALPEVQDQWQSVLSTIAILTMVLGNIIALVQDNVKRMLAYSSIAHVGYILVGLAAGTATAYSAVMYYIFAYTLMNVGAFGVVAYFEKQKGCDFTSVENYAGLGYKFPLLGVLMSIFMFSLIGVPPFAGFIGKYLVFSAAIAEGLVATVIVAALASVVGVYYYLRVIIYMYMHEQKQDYAFVPPTLAFSLTLTLIAALILYFGILPADLIALITTGISETTVHATTGIQY